MFLISKEHPDSEFRFAMAQSHELVGKNPEALFFLSRLLVKTKKPDGQGIDWWERIFPTPAMPILCADDLVVVVAEDTGLFERRTTSDFTRQDTTVALQAAEAWRKLMACTHKAMKKQ